MSRLEQQDTRDTITVRIDEETKDEYQNALDKSMSQDLRDYIKTVIETSDTTDIDRSNQRLRQAHQIIQRLSDEYDSQTLDTDIVESRLSSQLNIDKDAVRQGVLHQLQDQGLIKPLWGKILVIQEWPHTESYPTTETGESWKHRATQRITEPSAIIAKSQPQNEKLDA